MGPSSYCPRPSVRRPRAARVKQDDFHRAEEHRLGRPFLAPQPAVKVRLGDLEALGERLDSADYQAGAMQRASVDAGVLRWRQGAIPCRGRQVSHNGYGAAVSGHSQVAIHEVMVSIFGHRTPAGTASGPTLRGNSRPQDIYAVGTTIATSRRWTATRSRNPWPVPSRRRPSKWQRECWAARASCATCWEPLRPISRRGSRATRSRRTTYSSGAWK